MYQLLLQQRPTLPAAESPLQAMKRQLVRMTYRDRSTCDKLFPKLLAPQALQDAVTRLSQFLVDTAVDTHGAGGGKVGLAVAGAIRCSCMRLQRRINQTMRARGIR